MVHEMYSILEDVLSIAILNRRQESALVEEIGGEVKQYQVIFDLMLHIRVHVG